MFAIEYGPDSGILTLRDSFYFTIVTFSTVGYGDMSPVTSEGMVAVVAIIMISFIFLPVQVNKLSSAMTIHNKIYEFSQMLRIKETDPHVIVSGNLGSSHAFETFVVELLKRGGSVKQVGARSRLRAAVRYTQ